MGDECARNLVVIGACVLVGFCVSCTAGRGLQDLDAIADSVALRLESQGRRKNGS